MYLTEAQAAEVARRARLAGVTMSRFLAESGLIGSRGDVAALHAAGTQAKATRWEFGRVADNLKHLMMAAEKSPSVTPAMVREMQRVVTELRAAAQAADADVAVIEAGLVGGSG